MKAIAYKQFSDASEIVDIPEGACLRDAFSVADADAIFLVNGEEVPGDTIPAPGDIVAVRWVPHGIEVIIIGIVAAVALGGAIYAGVKAYEARKKANELEDQMKNMMKGMNDTVQNLPHIRGASNSIATGKSQPYIIGEHIFTPYKLASHWYKTEGTDGADQFYINVYEGGFNPQVLRELRAEEVLLRDFGSGSTPQEGVYQFDEASPFYDEDSFIEVSQDGAAFATGDFNIKIASEQSGTELKKADDDDYEDLIYTLPQYTRSADICILFNGLRGYNDDGAHIPRTVVVTPSYSLNSGGSWTDFTFDQNGTPSNSFTRDTMNQMRFIAHVDFTYGSVSSLTEPVLIRLTCSTNKTTNSSYDQVYVESVQSLIYNPDASATAGAFVNEKLIDDVEAAVSTRIGIKIKATASNQDKLSKVNIVTAGVARTWDGDEWSISKTPTRNLAAWILEVLTSPTHPASRLADSEIDLDSFGAAYEYYATEGVNVDLVLLDGDEKRSVLAALCELGGCMLYQNIYGETAIAIDAPKENAIAVINTQNLISLDAEKGFNRKADGIRVSYISRDGGYQPDSYLVMRDGVSRTSESLIRDIDVSGITEHSAIVRYARRLMAIEQLRPKMVKAKVGKEGIYYTPLSKVLVQHPALGNGLGSAEIESVIEEAGDIVGLRLREPILYDSTSPDGFGVIIQAVDDDYCSQIAAAYIADSDGRVSEIEFVTPISSGAAVIPHAGDILSYGYLNLGTFTSITSEMLITGIEVDDAGYLLSLVDYNEAIYDTGTIPDYTPNLTTLGVGPGAPGAPSTSLAEAMLAKEAASAASAEATRASVILSSSASSVSRNRLGTNNPASITFSAKLPDGTGYLGTFRISEDSGAGYVEVYESSSAESSHIHTVGANVTRVLCEFRVDIDESPSTIKQVVIDVSLSPDSAPMYWGARTSAPTSNIELGDTYFDSNVPASGGGILRYYNGVATWPELTSASARWVSTYQQAWSDVLAWSKHNPSISNELITATAIIAETISANTGFILNLFSQDITVPSGGKQRWYDGQGVNRRAIEVSDGRMDFIDAPDTSPASAEVLAARLGRLGVNGPAILDGEWRAEINGYMKEAEIPVSSGVALTDEIAAIERASGETRVMYRRQSDGYLCERVKAVGATNYGSETVLYSGAAYPGDYKEELDGKVRACFITTSGIKEKILTGSSWGSDSSISATGGEKLRYLLLEDNTLWLIRLSPSSVVERSIYNRDTPAWGAFATFGPGSVEVYSLAICEEEGLIRFAWDDSASAKEMTYDFTSWTDPIIPGGMDAENIRYFRTLDGVLHLGGTRGGIVISDLIDGAWATYETYSGDFECDAILATRNGGLSFYDVSDSYALTEYIYVHYARIGAGIEETDENSNGSYIKFSDGTLICLGETASVTGWASYGPDGYTYYSSSNPAIVYPAGFLSIPLFFTSVQQISGGVPLTSSYQIASPAPSISGCSVQISARCNTSMTLNAKVKWIAIGRWE